MSDDGKIWFSKSAGSITEFTEPLTYIEYLPCACGKSLEDALQFDRTAMVKLSFVGEYSQQVVCWECIRKNE